MAGREMVRNDETGQRYELLNNEWKPVYSDAEDTGAIETLLISAGKNMSDLGAGAHRLVMEVAGDEYGLEMLRRKQRAEQEIFNELQRERPVATAAGQMIPGVVAGIATGGIASLAGLGVKAVGAAAVLSSGIQGGLEYREDLSQQGINALLGAGLAAAGELGGEAIQRVRGARQFATEAQEAVAAQTLRVQQEILETARASRVATGVLDLPGIDGRLALEMQGQTVAQLGRRTDEIGDAARAMLSRPAANQTDEFGRLTQRAEQLGVRLTPGQLANDASMRQLEASIGSFPLSSRLEQARKSANRVTVNRVFGRALGLGDEVSELSPDVLGRVMNQVGEEFTAIGETMGRIEVDDAMMEGLSMIQSRNIASPIRSDRAVQVIDNMFDLAEVGDDGVIGISAPVLMNWRADINTLMRNASQNGDGNLSMRLRETLNVIDDSIARQAAPDISQRYVNARARYRLADALDRPGAIRNNNVMTGTMSTVFNKRYMAEFKHGDRFGSVMDQSLLDAFDVVRIGNQFGDIVGDSGTATRLSVQNMLNNPGGTITGELVSAGMRGTMKVVGDRLATPVAAAAIEGLRRGAPGILPVVAGGIVGGEAGRATERAVNQ